MSEKHIFYIGNLRIDKPNECSQCIIIGHTTANITTASHHREMTVRTNVLQLTQYKTQRSRNSNWYHISRKLNMQEYTKKQKQH